MTTEWSMVRTCLGYDNMNEHRMTVVTLRKMKSHGAVPNKVQETGCRTVPAHEWSAFQQLKD